MKFRQSSGVWKPTMSLARRPSSRAPRHGHCASTRARRPRDVPEGDDRARRQPTPEHPRRQREVVVLDEHERRIVLGFVDHRGSEPGVGAVVHPEVVGSEDRRHADVVAERPQALVREAVVVAAMLVVGEPHVAQPVARIGGWHIKSVATVDAAVVVGRSPVCHPCSRAAPDDRFERRHEATGRSFSADAAVGPANRSQRRTIRKHDHPHGSCLIRGASPLGLPDTLARSLATRPFALADPVRVASA